MFGIIQYKSHNQLIEPNKKTHLPNTLLNLTSVPTYSQSILTFHIQRNKSQPLNSNPFPPLSATKRSDKIKISGKEVVQRSTRFDFEASNQIPPNGVPTKTSETATAVRCPRFRSGQQRNWRRSAWKRATYAISHIWMQDLRRADDEVTRTPCGMMARGPYTRRHVRLLVSPREGKCARA